MKRILREIEKKPNKDISVTLQEETEEGHCQKDEDEQNTISEEAQQIFKKWKNVKTPK
jgi:hypothetical protein